MKSNKLLVRKKWPSAIRTLLINRPCGPRVPSMVATSLPRESSRTCVFFASHASYSRAFGGAHPPRRTRVSWHTHVVIERKRRTQKEEAIRPFTGNGKLTIIVDPDFVPAEFTLCCAASQGKGEVEAAYCQNFCDLCDEVQVGWFGVCPFPWQRQCGPWFVKLLPTGVPTEITRRSPPSFDSMCGLRASLSFISTQAAVPSRNFHILVSRNGRCCRSMMDQVYP